MEIKIAPSILSADFSKLAEQLELIKDADLLHIDVMDGHFVPNLTFGPVLVKSIKSCTKLPFDVHLMVSNPEDLIGPFVEAGADILTVHAEACKDLPELLREIRALGVKTGVSIRPKTPVSKILPHLDLIDMPLVMSVEPGFGGQKFMPDVLSKVKALRKEFEGDIEIDGGICPANAKQVVEAGANVLVAGSAVFGAKDISKAVEDLWNSANL